MHRVEVTDEEEACARFWPDGAGIQAGVCAAYVQGAKACDGKGLSNLSPEPCLHSIAHVTILLESVSANVSVAVVHAAHSSPGLTNEQLTNAAGLQAATEPVPTKRPRTTKYRKKACYVTDNMPPMFHRDSSKQQVVPCCISIAQCCSVA